MRLMGGIIGLAVLPLTGEPDEWVEGTTHALERITISSPVEEIVGEVMVKEGDVVEKDAVLAQLLSKQEVLEAKPKPLAYPKGKIKFGHYGEIVQDLIEAAKKIEDAEEKDALVLMCINLMKKHYVNWNRDTVEDEVILKDFEKLSKGELQLKDPSLITPTQELVRNKPKQQRRPQKRRSGGQQNRRRRS